MKNKNDGGREEHRQKTWHLNSVYVIIIHQNIFSSCTKNCDKWLAHLALPTISFPAFSKKISFLSTFCKS